jgi:hypothetical protein
MSEPLTADQLEQVRAMLGDDYAPVIDLAPGPMAETVKLLLGTSRRLLATLDAAEAASSDNADVWQQGYEACWNRLNDAGRLLPSEPEAASPDSEALRAALDDLVKWVTRYEATGMMADEIAMRASLDEARAALSTVEEKEK